MHCATQRAALRPRWLASPTPTVRRKDCVGQSPPMNKGGPRAAKPQDRHQNTATATATAKQQVAPVAMVRQGRRWHRYPIASASLYAPSCERTWWWISLRCPLCGSVHLHRVRNEEDADGVRRTGCGRRVFVVIRRTYRSKTSSGAAA